MASEAGTLPAAPFGGLLFVRNHYAASVILRVTTVRWAVEPRSKVWLEKDGKLALSGYRVRLLRLIDETGSLSDAAVAMGLSYRRAWGKLKEIEQNLGVKLVDTAVGGAGGGGSRLTAEGRRMIERFERFRAAAEHDLLRDFAQSFEADA